MSHSREAAEEIPPDFLDTSTSAYLPNTLANSFAKKMNHSICLIVRRNCDGNRSATLPPVKCRNLQGPNSSVKYMVPHVNLPLQTAEITIVSVDISIISEVESVTSTNTQPWHMHMYTIL
ncbi:hypothetical protein SCLCIDRAFT_1225459 [Scleroderma citrinum Foug A]|uniref:Uncharacterized protein n=1 Tax=Scleroderma citrinum Foug A TaxID=1036808 RepID=A0A0C2ZB03_9AGAM|nr:hypothetical protein SCLCIDRAFT_1225459 [Scleroderma citrinum Foug A]